MEKFELILSMSATIIGLIITTITFLSKFVKSAKAKKVAENIVEIGNAILPYIEEAEKLIAFSGEEKKAYVMTKANQFAIENNIKFDANKTSEKIDELIALTNRVNIRKTLNQNDGESATAAEQRSVASATTSTTLVIGKKEGH